MIVIRHRVTPYIDISILLYETDTALYATACIYDPLTHAKVLIADMNFPVGTTHEQAVALMCQKMRYVFNQCIDLYTTTGV